MSRGGLRRGRARAAVERCHSLSAWGRFQWALGADDGLQVAWREESGWAVIDFERDGGNHTERVQLAKTSCHYGGSRFWFLCPGCWRRVGKVYLPTGIYYRGVRMQQWRCRHCWGLTYEQRQIGRGGGAFGWLLEQRADRLLDHSGITVEQGYFRRPKRMRQVTFVRLVARHAALVARSNGTFMAIGGNQAWSSASGYTDLLEQIRQEGGERADGLEDGLAGRLPRLDGQHGQA
jgi:hypothetical protein